MAELNDRIRGLRKRLEDVRIGGIWAKLLIAGIALFFGFEAVNQIIKMVRGGYGSLLLVAACAGIAAVIFHIFKNTGNETDK